MNTNKKLGVFRHPYLRCGFTTSATQVWTFGAFLELQHNTLYYTIAKKLLKKPENLGDGVLRHPQLRCRFNTYSIEMNPNAICIEMRMS